MNGAPTGENQRVSSATRGAHSCPKPDLGLNRRQRITKTSDFQKVFSEGRKFVGKYMVMWVGTSPEPFFRLGVVTSMRSIRKAVHRVRARRLLRESFRLNRCLLKGSADIVLVARYHIAGVQRGVVEEDLLKLVRKAGFLSKKDEPFDK